MMINVGLDATVLVPSLESLTAGWCQSYSPLPWESHCSAEQYWFSHLVTLADHNVCWDSPGSPDFTTIQCKDTEFSMYIFQSCHTNPNNRCSWNWNNQHLAHSLYMANSHGWVTVYSRLEPVLILKMSKCFLYMPYYYIKIHGSGVTMAWQYVVCHFQYTSFMGL